VEKTETEVQISARTRWGKSRSDGELVHGGRRGYGKRRCSDSRGSTTRTASAKRVAVCQTDRAQSGMGQNTIGRAIRVASEYRRQEKTEVAGDASTEAAEGVQSRGSSIPGQL